MAMVLKKFKNRRLKIPNGGIIVYMTRKGNVNMKLRFELK